MTHAVAVAIAASGGQDHYRYNPGWSDSTERRGLFALTLDEHPLGPDADLFNPEVSAMAAHALWEAGDRSWRWHLAHVSGEADKQHDYVTAALAGSGDAHGSVAAGTFRMNLAAIMHYTDRIREATRMVRGGYE